MRFLVFYKSSLLRHFDTTLETLAKEGHEIVVVTPHGNMTSKVPGELAAYPAVSIIRDETSKAQDPTLKLVRAARNFFRYFDPRLAAGRVNRERAWERLAEIASDRGRSELPDAPSLDLTSSERRVVWRALAAIEEVFPPAELTLEFLARHEPDAVLVTPLVTSYARQTEVVKAAKALGIPCGLLVFSWDNLSNKGVIHAVPHQVFVWNEIQAHEAVELHGVPREDVVVTGAPRFDSFFEISPKLSRVELKQRYGLAPERPLVLFLGSSPFVSRNERQVFEHWLDARRQADDPLVREAAVFVRPHPRGRHYWSEFDEGQHEGVVVDRKSSIYRLRDLYSQLDAADAVVGLNTSAQIEAAILGKPVYTFSAGELAPGQEGSTHFYYLLRENGGFVEYSPDLPQHFEQLSRGMRGEFDADAIRRFVESFVRPHGLDRPAAPILAEALVRLAETEVPAASEVKMAAARSRLDPRPVHWLEEKARAADVVFDIGARAGAYSLVAARVTENVGRVFAFEADAGKYSRLCDRVALEGLGGRIVPMPFALADRTRLTTEAGREGVRITLDHAIRVFGLPVPNLILIDVGGRARDVIAGARDTLENPALRDVLVNLGGGNGDELVAELAAAGLELRGRHEAGSRSGSPDGEWKPEWWYGEFSRSGGEGEQPVTQAAQVSAR